MREAAGRQLSLVNTPVHHVHALELASVSALLDEADGLAELVQADLLRRVKNPKTGRRGMTGDLVLRVLMVKQMNGFSYEELAFHLLDSSTYRTFCRLGLAATVPSAKTLQRNIKKVRPETLADVNRLLMKIAQQRGIECGAKMRGDCTATESNIHAPTDSTLLDDCVRVLTRAMHRAKELVRVGFTDHTKRARRRTIAIQYAARKLARVPLYKDLMKVALQTAGAAERAAEVLDRFGGSDPVALAQAIALAAELRHYVGLTRRVLDQTHRRIVEGESVPATEKVVSIFEPHTDIICKDNRNTLYGHELYLSSGASGLITDCVVLDGNPCDSTRVIDAVERHREVFGERPRQVAFDGGFASRANLEAVKERGVTDVVFAKGRGLQVSEMAKSTLTTLAPCDRRRIADRAAGPGPRRERRREWGRHRDAIFNHSSHIATHNKNRPDNSQLQPTPARMAVDLHQCRHIASHPSATDQRTRARHRVRSKVSRTAHGQRQSGSAPLTTQLGQSPRPRGLPLAIRASAPSTRGAPTWAPPISSSRGYPLTEGR